VQFFLWLLGEFMVNKHLNLTSRDLLKKIGKQKTSREYRNKETIVSPGDASDAMFYIQAGNVKLTVISSRGKRAVLAILRQRDFFGERCLVSRSLRRLPQRQFSRPLSHE
jgi:CRP-like cAMP-binding protein